MNLPDTPVTSTCEAVAAVAEASRQWSAVPYSGRARVIHAIANALDTAAADLIATAQEETNLPEARLVGELRRTTFQLRLFADVVADGAFLDARIDRPDAAWPMGAPRPDLRRMLVPIGPVLVFAASNFPFAFSVAGGDTAAALAAGNAVLVKAHSGHPRLSNATAAVVRAAGRAAGAPENLLRVIHETEKGVTALQDPRIRAASFTGSIRGGRALFDIANARPEPIPFYGELGSVNPAFVAPTAGFRRSSEIVDGFLSSITGSRGQLCTKPGLLLVPAESSMLAMLRDADVPDATPMLNNRIQKGFEADLAALKRHSGVSTLLENANKIAPSPGTTLLHTTLDQVLAAPDALTTEVFGPAGLIVTYSDPAEVPEFARTLAGQLTATIIAEPDAASDITLAQELLPILTEKAGRLLWNQWPTGVSVTYAQQHGGPYPATTAPTTTSVGTASITRFLRPVAFQNFPSTFLPDALNDRNPLGVPQRIDG